ncbi:phospholipase D-like domain-containing protein [Zooshikella ganghwensis]|uniref:PLD phosphodiesterase domain-containing protein n=1 Tax=Zooshikella ganghwensis TaxID=202772 RepID=A0A4P9VTH5_9GAMM|nr:phospholipase D-like domain-containing protein [Zooshikella ganghwensis]RDH46169.1 hypothetical protein B9G39_23460 [Zooshikella ganghwensis]
MRAFGSSAPANRSYLAGAHRIGQPVFPIPTGGPTSVLLDSLGKRIAGHPDWPDLPVVEQAIKDTMDIKIEDHHLIDFAKIHWEQRYGLPKGLPPFNYIEWKTINGSVADERGHKRQGHGKAVADLSDIKTWHVDHKSIPLSAEATHAFFRVLRNQTIDASDWAYMITAQIRAESTDLLSQSYKEQLQYAAALAYRSTNVNNEAGELSSVEVSVIDRLLNGNPTVVTFIPHLPAKGYAPFNLNGVKSTGHIPTITSKNHVLVVDEASGVFLWYFAGGPLNGFRGGFTSKEEAITWYKNWLTNQGGRASAKHKGNVYPYYNSNFESYLILDESGRWSLKKTFNFDLSHWRREKADQLKLLPIGNISYGRAMADQFFKATRADIDSQYKQRNEQFTEDLRYWYDFAATAAAILGVGTSGHLSKVLDFSVIAGGVGVGGVTIANADNPNEVLEGIGAIIEAAADTMEATGVGDRLSRKSSVIRNLFRGGSTKAYQRSAQKADLNQPASIVFENKAPHALQRELSQIWNSPQGESAYNAKKLDIIKDDKHLECILYQGKGYTRHQNGNWFAIKLDLSLVKDAEIDKSNSSKQQNKNQQSIHDVTARHTQVKNTIKEISNGKRVVVFSGFSGLGYEDNVNLESTLNTVLDREIELYGRENLLIVAGATEDGIGTVYEIAKNKNLNTFGIVSEEAEKNDVPISSSCDRHVFIPDANSSWQVLDPSGESYMVSIANSSNIKGKFYAFGGGSVTVTELSEAIKHGIDTEVFGDFLPNPEKVQQKIEKLKSRGQNTENVDFTPLKTHLNNKTNTVDSNNSFTKKLLSKISKNNEGVAADSQALALVDSTILSESEQASASEAIIKSADQTAVITSYAIAITPIRIKYKGPDGKVVNGPVRISPTLKAMLDGIAEKQNEEGFTFVFAYNKSKGIQNWHLGHKRTDATHKVDPDNPDSNPWIDVIKEYNKQSNTPITNLEANFIIVGLDPHGPAGSHHSKILANDNGVLGVTGASLGHVGKDHVADSGAFVASQHLADHELNFFANSTLQHAKAVSRLRVADGNVELEKITPSSFRANFKRRLKNNPVNSPISQATNRLKDIVTQTFGKGYNVLNVAFLHNKPSMNPAAHLTTRFNSSPIGKAIKQLFDTSLPGETIKIRNEYLDSDIRKLIISAITKGVNIELIQIDSDNKKNLSPKRELLLKEIRKLNSINQNSGRFTFYDHANRSTTSKHNVKFGISRDHAKTYILERSDKDIIITGSYNLDDQSIYRSSESVLLIEVQDPLLRQRLFDNLKPIN